MLIYPCFWFCFQAKHRKISITIFIFGVKKINTLSGITIHEQSCEWQLKMDDLLHPFFSEAVLHLAQVQEKYFLGRWANWRWVFIELLCPVTSRQKMLCKLVTQRLCTSVVFSETLLYGLPLSRWQTIF